jgi:hypothetical protein
MSDATLMSEGGRPPGGKQLRLGRFGRNLLKIAIVLGVALLSEHVFEVLRANRIADMRQFNDNLKKAIGNFSPMSMSTNFSGRLRDDYGWRLLSLRAPFNLTAARDSLLEQYPLVARHLKFWFRANAVIGELSDNAELQRQLAAYHEGLARINQYRFPQWVPGFVSKTLGLPDAFMFMVRGIFAGSLVGKVIGCLALVIVLAFLFSPRCRSLPGAIMLLPLFITLIAWVLFLPVHLAAAVLDWVVLHLFGSPMNAPETSVAAGLSCLWPINWVTQKLAEHHVTEALLKEVDRG